MSEILVEQVALAILRKLQNHRHGSGFSDFLSDPFTPNSEDIWQTIAETEGVRVFNGSIAVKEIARAAIAAIYEPIDENIERVARALCLAQRQDPDEREILHIPSVVGRASGTTPPTVMKAIIAEPRWKRYTGDARAAIDAMLKG